MEEQKQDTTLKLQLKTVQTFDEVDLRKHGVMSGMDRTGDTKVIWSRDNPDEVEVAREQFKSFRKKGFAAFRAKGKEGDKGEQIFDFDPSAERIIFVPQMAGG